MAHDYKCPNCEWTGAEKDADPIQDIHARLEPGDIYPAGECPKCGALVEPSATKPGERALRSLLDAVAEIESVASDGIYDDSETGELYPDIQELLDTYNTFLRSTPQPEA